MKSKKMFKKLWHVFWHEDSFTSLTLNFAAAFVLIKWLFLPALGLLLGTKVPVVAVVSNSMMHDNSFNEKWNTEFDSWWHKKCGKDLMENKILTQEDFYKNFGINKKSFLQYIFSYGFNMGDILIITSAKEIKKGDVIVFNADRAKEPVIHRVIKVQGNVFKTKGDNNCGTAGFEEKIPENRVLGKAVFRLPYLGWIKIVFVFIISLFWR